MPGIEVQDRLIERSVTGRVVVTEESCCPEIVRISGAGCEMLKDIETGGDTTLTALRAAMKTEYVPGASGSVT